MPLSPSVLGSERLGVDAVLGGPYVIGSDTGTGSESGTVQASTFHPPTVIIPSYPPFYPGETVTVLPGRGESYPPFYPPAYPTGASPTSGGRETGTGSESGFVRLSPVAVNADDLSVSLYAVHPTTGQLLALPDCTKLTIAPARNGAGSISVEYPVDGLNFAALYGGTVGADRDLEVEIWLTGSSAGSMRGYLQEASGDDVAEQSVWTFAGGFLELRLAEIVVYPQFLNSPTTSGTQEIVFTTVTPGAVIGTLLSQAQGRGALTDITKGFSDSVDSDGAAWPNVLTTKFSPGSGYDQVLSKFVDLGLVEWAVTWTGTARRLDLWIPGSRGVDRTTGARPVVLRAGRNLTESPRKWSVKDSATSVLAAGAQGIYAAGSDISAFTRRGRRIEVTTSASNLSDLGAVQAFVGVQLAAVAPGALEVTHGLGFLPGEPRPSIAFGVGDWLYSQVGSAMDRLRVVAWSLTVDATGQPAGTVTLNDSIAEALVKLKDRLNALSSGDTVIGTSVSSHDTSTPNPPTNLSATSAAFMVGGLSHAAVTVAWTAPVQNTDGSVLADLAGFKIQYGFGSAPSTWTDAATVSVSAAAPSGQFTTTPNQLILIRVAAYDSSGNQSAWSTPISHTTASDVTIPPPCSAPVVSNYLGVLTIAWDGLTSTGDEMHAAAPDFDHVDVHLSTTSGFNPSVSTYFDRLFAAGTVVYTDGVYGTTYYAKLVPVDASGNAGAASAQASDSPQQVVSLDVFAGAIGTAQLAEAAITTAKINDLAVNNAKIGDLSVGKLTAGILSVAVTLSGIIRTAASGNRFEADGAGIRLYNGTTAVVNFKTFDGSALVTGQYQTALTGQRLVLNPGGTVPDTVNVYPSGGGDFARIMARTAPSDGSAAILIDGGASTGAGRGRLGAYKSEAFVSYVTSDTGGDSQSGFSMTAVSCSAANVGMWAQGKITFAKYSGASQLGGSAGWLMWANGSDANCLVLGASQQDAGIKFDAGTTCAVNAIGTLFGPMKATAYQFPSGEDVKTDVVPVSTLFTPLDVVRDAPSKAWRYTDEVDQQGAGAPLHFGPMADDLPAELVRMTPSADGSGPEKSIDVAAMMGTLWSTVGQLLARRITSTTATCAVPAGTTIAVGSSVEVACSWESAPPATPTDAIVFLNTGLLGAGRVTAWLKAGSITATGCTVVFRNTSAGQVRSLANALAGLTSITATVVGQALWTPPGATY